MTHSRRRPPSAAREPQIRNVTLLAHFDTHIYKELPRPEGGRYAFPPDAFGGLPRRAAGGNNRHSRASEAPPAPRRKKSPPSSPPPRGEDTDGGSPARPPRDPALPPEMTHFLSLFPPALRGEDTDGGSSPGSPDGGSPSAARDPLPSEAAAPSYGTRCLSTYI